MSLEFIDLNSPTIVAGNCDTRKTMEKKNGTERDLKIKQKMVTQSLGRK